MKIAFYIASGQKGVILSTAKEISMISGCEVYIVARDRNVSNLVNKLLPDMHDNIIDLSKIKEKLVVNKSIVERAIRMENIIGEYSSMLSSYDRSIGQGYLSNADKHPHIVSSLYTHKEKLKKIVEEFECSEILVNKYNLKIFFGFQRPVI